jgi:putative ABC transport system permease protein
VADFRLVSASYFRALGRLRRGRTLSERDRDNTPLVAVINDTMARTFFGADDPIGQRLPMDGPGFGPMYSADAAPFAIVGVIADERVTSFDDARARAVVYVGQEQDSRGFAGIVLRMSIELPHATLASRRDRACRQGSSGREHQDDRRIEGRVVGR